MTEAKDKNQGIYSLTEPVTMIVYIKAGEHPLFTPRPYIGKNGKPQGEPKYAADFVFNADSQDLKNMKALAAKLARMKWPDKPFDQLVFPFKNGDKEADKAAEKDKDRENLRGKVIVKGSSQYPARLSYIENGKIVDLENEAALLQAKPKFYSGVKALAQFNFVAYDAIGENAKGGVTAYLQIVLSTGKGEKLSGGMTAAEAFKGYVGSMSTDNPEAPGAGQNLDEIPL